MQIKSAYTEGTMPNQNKLLTAEIPRLHIKQGVMMKIGGNVKSWKRRFFVAKNKADNFAISYYDDEQLTNEKGRICCCG